MKVGPKKLSFTTVVALLPLTFFELSAVWSGIGILAMTVLPFVFSWIAIRSPPISNPVFILGFMYVMGVSAPTIFSSFYGAGRLDHLTETDLAFAALWMFRGWACFCFFYWLQRVSKPSTHNLSMESSSSTNSSSERVLVFLIGVVSLAGTFLYLVLLRGRTYQILEEAAVQDSTSIQIAILCKNLAYAFIYFCTIRASSDGLNRAEKILLVIILIAQSIVFIGSGSKYAALSILASWFLASVIVRPTGGLLKHSKYILLGVAAVYILSSVVAAYRGELVSRRLPDAGDGIVSVITFQIDVFSDAVLKTLTGESVSARFYGDGYDYSSVIDRFALVKNFALIISVTNREPPKENPIATVLSPMISLLPRSIIPGKPSFFDSGDFAQMNGWAYGGISVTTIGSFYWAWGYIGILAGMAVLGYSVSFLWSAIETSPRKSVIGSAVFLMTFVMMLNLGVTIQSLATWGMRVFVLTFVLSTIAKIFVGYRNKK